MCSDIRYGAFLILPLKYENDLPQLPLPRRPILSGDLTETVRSMLNGDSRNVGCCYALSRRRLLRSMTPDGDAVCSCTVTDGEARHRFVMGASRLYLFRTRVAFLCLQLTVESMEGLYAVCAPGLSSLHTQYAWQDAAGTDHPFCLESWLKNTCDSLGLQPFFDRCKLLPEAYAHIVMLRRQPYRSLEELRQVTFNLHRMRDPATQDMDDAESDIRYTYAVMDPVLNGFRWGCCVSSQTACYAVCDAKLSLRREMAAQARDSLPLILLALYEKYTCLRFTQLMADIETRHPAQLEQLTVLMQDFKAYGTFTAANLSRWYNVRQIYEYLLEVCDIRRSVQDISEKLEILAQRRQQREQRRSEAISNLFTVFGVISILADALGIVQILTEGGSLLWATALLTGGLLVLLLLILQLKKS